MWDIEQYEVVVTGGPVKTSDLEKLSSQSGKQLEMGIPSVSRWKVHKVRLATSCVYNEIQVRHVLLDGHCIHVERVTKQSRKQEVAILHQIGKDMQNSVCLVHMGICNSSRAPNSRCKRQMHL